MAIGVRTDFDTKGTLWRSHWEHSYPVPAYLFAIAVGPYREITRTLELRDGALLPIQHFFNPIDTIPEGWLYNDQAQMFDSFEEWYGPYPFRDEQYGNVWTTRSGGMEHQTMSHVGVWNVALFAHELVHQWFGDKVTNGSWQHLWLHEGFAVYCTQLILFRQSPSFAGAFLRRDEDRLRNQARTGSVFARDTSDVFQLFSQALRYRKPGLLLRELEYRIGFDTLALAMRNFANDPDLAYGYATTDDFLRHVNLATGEDYTWWFDQHIYGYGLPFYRISYTDAPGGIRVTLEQSNTDPRGGFKRQLLPLRLVGRNEEGAIVSKDARVDITALEQSLDIAFPGTLDSLVLDPEHWVVTDKPQILDLRASADLNVGPNPFQDELKVFFPQGRFESGALRVVDVSGREVYSTGFTNTNQLRIDAKDWAQGAYVLEVSTSGGTTISRRLVRVD